MQGLKSYHLSPGRGLNELKTQSTVKLEMLDDLEVFFSNLTSNISDCEIISFILHDYNDFTNISYTSLNSKAESFFNCSGTNSRLC